MEASNTVSERYLFTSESVTEGHPDKLADQISDAVLDAILAQDPQGRVACETLLTTGLVLIAGEITTRARIDASDIARRVVREAGYTDTTYGFDAQTCGVLTALQRQSKNISVGVDRGGAGDQGMMFGYACNETPELMPMPIMLAHRLARRLAEVRKGGLLPYLRPDGKTQVTIDYVEGKPQRLHTVLISAQHEPGITQEQIRSDLHTLVLKDVLPESLDRSGMLFLVNPTGVFEVGGPRGDTGLTGRKIIVDTYGGMAPHGGGAFSGKDPTKVDRSAAYMARYAARNVVAAGLSDRCEIQVAYAIGRTEPISLLVRTFGTAREDEPLIAAHVCEHFDFTPSGIITTLDLRRPIYRQTAAYGHFGRTDLDVPWERNDKANELRRSAGF